MLTARAEEVARSVGLELGADDYLCGYAGTVRSRTVDTCVRRLRRKLGPAGAAIETLIGVGYRLRG